MSSRRLLSLLFFSLLSSGVLGGLDEKFYPLHLIPIISPDGVSSEAGDCIGALVSNEHILAAGECLMMSKKRKAPAVFADYRKEKFHSEGEYPMADFLFSKNITFAPNGEYALITLHTPFKPSGPTVVPVKVTASIDKVSQVISFKKEAKKVIPLTRSGKNFAEYNAKGMLRSLNGKGIAQNHICAFLDSTTGGKVKCAKRLPSFLTKKTRPLWAKKDAAPPATTTPPPTTTAALPSTTTMSSSDLELHTVDRSAVTNSSVLSSPSRDIVAATTSFAPPKLQMDAAKPQRLQVYILAWLACGVVVVLATLYGIKRIGTAFINVCFDLRDLYKRRRGGYDTFVDGPDPSGYVIACEASTPIPTNAEDGEEVAANDGGEDVVQIVNEEVELMMEEVEEKQKEASEMLDALKKVTRGLSEINEAGDVAAEYACEAKDKTGNIYEGVKERVSGSAEDAKNRAQDVAEDASQYVQDKAGNLCDKANNVVYKAGEYVLDKENMVGRMEEAAEELKDYVKDSAGNLRNKANNIV